MTTETDISHTVITKTGGLTIVTDSSGIPPMVRLFIADSSDQVLPENQECAKTIEGLLNLCFREGVHLAKIAEELSMEASNLIACGIAKAIKDDLLPGCPLCDSKDVTYPGNMIVCRNNDCRRFAPFAYN